MKEFIGRDKELSVLKELYSAKQAKIIALYGRRRIGKSSLINHFSIGKTSFSFEGLESVSTKGQLEHFFNTLKTQSKDPLLSAPFETWDQAFKFLTERQITDEKQKIILFFELWHLKMSWICGFC